MGIYGRRSVTAGAAKKLIDCETRYAKNYDSDQINLKAARAASLHQRGGMTLRKIALILNSVCHGKSSKEFLG